MRVFFILFQSSFNRLFSLFFAAFRRYWSCNFSVRLAFSSAHVFYFTSSYSLSLLAYCSQACAQASFFLNLSYSLAYFYCKDSCFQEKAFRSRTSSLFFCQSQFSECFCSFAWLSWTYTSFFSLARAASNSDFSLTFSSLYFQASVFFASNLVVSSKHLALRSFSSLKYCALYCWQISFVCLSQLSKSSIFLSLISIIFLRCSSSLGLYSLQQASPSLANSFENI